jgi:hypothetical protein
MELPSNFRFIVPELTPLHLWPRRWKRLILALAILAVIVAYLLMTVGVVALLAILSDWLGNGFS